jgi:hypothetical protein
MTEAQRGQGDEDTTTGGQEGRAMRKPGGQDYEETRSQDYEETRSQDYEETRKPGENGRNLTK